jgi:hypothetical protein
LFDAKARFADASDGGENMTEKSILNPNEKLDLITSCL